MKVVILAGGLGTRLKEETENIPKPMIPIGGKPILWHIMKNYAHFDYKEFIICAGYKNEVIKSYFKNFEILNSDFTVTLGDTNSLKIHEKIEESGWLVTVLSTGLETMTGGRIYRARDYIGKETFFCTYGDGLSNVNIPSLLEFHKNHGKIATVTAVNPISRFGVLDLSNDGIVEKFREKPQSDSWINSGFFVFEPQIFDYLDQDSTLEKEPMMNLAKQGQLVAYKHSGFWQAMDTYRELTILNKLWSEGNNLWKA